MVGHSLLLGYAALQSISAIPTARHLQEDEEPGKQPAEHLRDFFIVVVVIAIIICIIGYARGVYV